MANHHLEPITAADPPVVIGYRCEVCDQEWKREPTSTCPGVPVYSWAPWPKGMLTKRQLAAKKLLPGPVAGVIRYDKSADGDGWLRVYRESEATPRPALSPKRQAAVEKMHIAAREARTCRNCGGHLYTRAERHQHCCFFCQRKLMIEAARHAAGHVAYDLICTGDFVVWDSETTDLGGQFLEIAVIDAYGKTLFDQRIRPQCLIAPRAYDVHGIRDEELASAPTFVEVYDELRAALHEKHWVIYNAEYDTRCLHHAKHDTIYRHYFAEKPIECADVTCAMYLYAEWYGEYSDY
jgi:hypothetical protein